MSINDMQGHYDRYVEAWNDHDPKAVMEMFAEGGTAVDPATDGRLTGAEIGEWVEETTRAFPDVQFDINRSVSDGDEVLFAEWRMRGTHEGSLNGLPPTGRSLDLDGVDVVTISDEGITSVRGYFDMSEVNEQLGLTFPTVIGQLPKLVIGGVRNAL